MPTRPLKIAYVRVEDRDYPRNARIRAYLQDRGHHIRVSDRARGGRISRSLRDVREIFRVTRGADVVVVPEFSLPFVPLVWLAARSARAQLVVDGFVGKYETVIEDWHRASPRSLRALWCRMVDARAARLASVYLTDTRVRARAATARHRLTPPALSLPVGAPEWISATMPEPADHLRVLFYGSALPLHGIPTIIQGLALTTIASTSLTLVGGERIHEYREMARRLGVEDRCTFVGTLGTEELNRVIAAHDVVLGTFGDSPKALSVIANKVWQGLAAGRTVITGKNPAMAEIDSLVGPQLIQVDGAEELASALDGLTAAPGTWYPHTAGILSDYVANEFEGLARRIESARTPVVLHALDDLSGGGAQRVAVDIMKHSDQQGIRSVVVAETGTSVRMLPNSTTFVEVPSGGFLRYVRTLDRACRQYRPTVLHAHQRREALACLIVSAVRGIPVVEHAHTVLPDQKLKPLSFRTRRTFSVGPAVTAMLERDFHRDSRGIVEIGNVVPTRAVRTKPPVRARVTDPLSVIAVGRLSEQKNPRAFVDLVAALNRTAPVTATWLGDGELRAETEHYAESLGVDITFAGFVDDVIARMDSADALLLTSTWEGNPLVALEAFSRGLPVAGYAVPGVAESLSEGRGILLDEGVSIEEQAAQIRSALFAPERRDMTRTALSHARRFVSPAEVYAPVIEAYRTLTF
ncbi:glycosyltransferase [Mycetocola tolaasinivorans]|uniref:Glycosyltransferase n=1 Tax=Mycetocola tolaasinivorans TaxID=76635 RepID=A0A3L7ADL6_9MICO|nr:glycosyltransferase [Mycetocola tolaasinivorans]RLP77808.1 glycosyltransferase [Mycetocola tolaasinivorans]